MKHRCFNEKNPQYPHYGGRGITMCDEWSGDDVESFVNFAKFFHPKPSPKHSIDRIDNDKGYFPDNVRWATQKEQTNNFRRNRHIEFDGKLESKEGVYQIEKVMNTEGNHYSGTVKLAEGVSVNDLIRAIIDQVELKALHENIPTMNDIFIKAVNQA